MSFSAHVLFFLDDLLRRDPRMVERKKTGLAKARKRVCFQLIFLSRASLLTIQWFYSTLGSSDRGGRGKRGSNEALFLHGYESLGEPLRNCVSICIKGGSFVHILCSIYAHAVTSITINPVSSKLLTFADGPKKYRKSSTRIGGSVTGRCGV